MTLDFEREVTEIAAMIEPKHGYELAPETIPIAITALEEVDSKYGPSSDHPLSFHNAPHSLGVTRRVVRLTNMLYPFIQPKYQNGIYDLGIIGGATHDIEQELGPGENERVSAESAGRQVSDADGVLNTTTFKKRLTRGIVATTVEMKEDGELVQTNLQSGTHDPIKFGMAFADINGIAMEGSKRMWQDATNLYYELNDEPTIGGLFDFYLSQAGFLRQRLNDGRVKSDIAYYFADDIEAVYQVMRGAFHANIVSAHGMAVLLGERPELSNTVGSVVKGIGALDRSLLGTMIGKMIERKVANDQSKVPGS